MKPCEVPRWQLLKSELSNLSFDDFVAQYKRDDNSVCLDVRTVEEFEFDKIDGAINLNYLSPDLADQLEKLDSHKSYYIYCRTGRRSVRVCVLLRNMGFNVHNLNNGISNH